MDLVSLLIALILFGVIAWIVVWIVGQIPMPQPIKVAVYAILGLIAILYLVGFLPGGHPVLFYPHNR